MDRNHDPRRRRHNQNQGYHQNPNQGNNAHRQDRSLSANLSYEEKFPVPARPAPRDYPPCPISGQAIDNIYTALVHRESEQPANFDAVLELLRNAEGLSENQKLLYVGSGCFGVYEEVEENGRRRLVLQRKVSYEDSHHKPDWRRELAPGISRDYQPTPEPLSQLYSSEELSQFPKIGAASGAYMPRSS